MNFWSHGVVVLRCDQTQLATHLGVHDVLFLVQHKQNGLGFYPQTQWKVGLLASFATYHVKYALIVTSPRSKGVEQFNSHKFLCILLRKSSAECWQTYPIALYNGCYTISETYPASVQHSARCKSGIGVHSTPRGNNAPHDRSRSGRSQRHCR